MSEQTVTKINSKTHSKLKVQAAIEQKTMIELLDEILGPVLDERAVKTPRAQ